MKWKIKSIILFIYLFVFAAGFDVQAQNVSDYLIINNISNYEFITQTKDFITGQIKPKPGYTTRIAPGILAGTDHFDLDHNDTTYETDYINKNIELAVEVQVTQHTGSDSDSWVLHEVERGFRRVKDLHATYVAPNPLREINGNKIFYTWGYYRWISNTIVVCIEFSDITGTKPEPLEVVQAYLQKHPSTIPASLVLNKAHDEQWIKDEMDRRLWLGDKWFLHQEQGKVDITKALKEVLDHLEVFLDYREKYYGISSANEKKLLNEYLYAKNATAIKNKLAEYKQWWNANKNNPINLP